MTPIWKEDGRANSAIITATVLKAPCSQACGAVGSSSVPLFPSVTSCSPFLSGCAAVALPSSSHRWTGREGTEKESQSPEPLEHHRQLHHYLGQERIQECKGLAHGR